MTPAPGPQAVFNSFLRCATLRPSLPTSKRAMTRRSNIRVAKFETRLAIRPSMSGEKNGLLDFAALPFVRQFRIANPVWFDAQPWPHLHRWLQAFLESQQFASVMKKYTVWQEGDDGVAFPETKERESGDAAHAGTSVG